MPSIVNAGLSAVSLFVTLVVAFVLAMSGCVSGHKTSRSMPPLRDASVEALEVPPPTTQPTPPPPAAAPPVAEAALARDGGPARDVGDGPRAAASDVARRAILAHAIREAAFPPLPPLPPPSAAATTPQEQEEDDATTSPPAAAAAPLPEAPSGGGVALKYARQALGNVSVADCRARGLPAGYGHAKVTFDSSGRATSVHVDGVDGVLREALACVGERLGQAKVEPFEGSPITVGTSWYLP